MSARPRHVGVVMDGNRRWARARGLSDPSQGHTRGADHVEDLLGSCEDRGVEHVTIYVLSADNVRRRSAAEIGHLVGLITDTLPGVVERAGRWTLHVSGDVALLGEAAVRALAEARRRTAGRPAHLTLAIGYDGREDIVAGIRAALRAGSEDASLGLTPQAITAHLPGGPVKEIDLVIRTSGEQRLSGFVPWQAAHAEIHVSDKLWPDFSAEDFDRALGAYATAQDHP